MNFQKLAKNSGHDFVYGREKIGGPWKELGKTEKHKTEIATRNKTQMLNDEWVILEITTPEKNPIAAKEVHYHDECKRNYLHEDDKSSNIKDSALERLLSYIRNKILAGNKLDLASFY